MNDIEKLEKLLDFYKSETYDSDLKTYMSNDIISSFVIDKYYPSRLNNGEYNINIHWTGYLVVLIKEQYFEIYQRTLEKIGITDKRVLSENDLTLIEERTLVAISMRLLDREEKTEVGKKLVTLTKYLIDKRQNQIKELTKQIYEIKKMGESYGDSPI